MVRSEKDLLLAVTLSHNQGDVVDLVDIIPPHAADVLAEAERREEAIIAAAQPAGELAVFGASA